MAPHRYIVGQQVEFQPSAFEGHIPPGAYTITRALPGDDQDRSYRARGRLDGIERVFREAQLRPGPASPFR